MQEVFPNYYEKFKCIADKCRHSCCIGWEIEYCEENTKKVADFLQAKNKK